MPRRCALVAASLAFAACAISTARAQPSANGLGDPERPQRRLIVTVVTRNDRGRVFCALWRGREGYPTRREHAVGEAMDRTVRGRRAVCVFDDVEPGDGYAVAVFHDENANNDLDRNIFGIPSEGTGASNDAHNMFGPPHYDHARFRVPAVPEHRMTIHIHY